MIRLFRRKHHDHPAPVQHHEDDRRAREAEARADAVAIRSERVARSLEKRLLDNHFAEGIAVAWGAKPRPR